MFDYEQSSRAFFRVVRRIWRIIPTNLRHEFWVRYYARLTRRYVASNSIGTTPRVDIAPTSTVVIAGLFRAANGLGEAARSTYRSLSAAGLSPIAVDVTAAIVPPDMDSSVPLSPFPSNGSGTLLLHVNPPETVRALDYLRRPDRRRWRFIGYWAWELPTFPTDWGIGFDLVDEVWTLSEFTAQTLATHPHRTEIRWSPIAVCPPDGIRANRALFGLDDGVFTVITLADALSSFARKNTVGAIEAFRLAFGSRTDCELIVKTRNLSSQPNARRRIERAISGSTNIRVLDTSLPDSDRWTLLASVDALISLHRAEGFALGPAEAMALGKPVIATAWSGNMSYMTADTAELVDYRLTSVEDEFGIYANTGGDATWAEPDVQQAARALQRLEGDRDYAQEMGRRAECRVKDVLNPVRVGLRLTTFLWRQLSNKVYSSS